MCLHQETSIIPTPNVIFHVLHLPRNIWWVFMPVCSREKPCSHHEQKSSVVKLGVIPALWEFSTSLIFRTKCWVCGLCNKPVFIFLIQRLQLNYQQWVVLKVLQIWIVSSITCKILFENSIINFWHCFVKV